MHVLGAEPAQGRAQAHADKVGRVADQLRRRRSARPLSLRKRAVSHQVPKARDAKYTDERIDISDLDAILEIDPVRRTCVAESGVTFVELVAATMHYGLVPVVVPELKTITIGGAVSGCSLESTSFKHGGFHDSCLEYEVITGTGAVLTCTPENENRLLFQMMHGTFGTLGILSRLKFRLVPARPFVRLDYERYDRLADYGAAIARQAEAEHADFMDGMINGQRDFVLCVGRFVDEAPYRSRYDWTKAYCDSTRHRAHDYLRTADYLFRYDRGVTCVHPRSFLGRLLLGRFFGSTELLRLAEALHALLPAEQPRVVLDVFLPFSRVEAFFGWYERAIGHFPVWCVPYRPVRDYEWLSPRFHGATRDRLFLDFGIYGMKQPRGANIYRLLEEKLLELDGMKTLISHNYFSPAEFWSIWNKENYDRAKAVADPHNVFRDLYAKTCRASRGVTD
jgi:FAD/FMN-containing dehydrogenase